MYPGLRLEDKGTNSLCQCAFKDGSLMFRGTDGSRNKVIAFSFMALLWLMIPFHLFTSQMQPSLAIPVSTKWKPTSLLHVMSNTLFILICMSFKDLFHEERGTFRAFQSVIPGPPASLRVLLEMQSPKSQPAPKLESTFEQTP